MGRRVERLDRELVGKVLGKVASMVLCKVRWQYHLNLGGGLRQAHEHDENEHMAGSKMVRTGRERQVAIVVRTGSQSIYQVFICAVSK